MALVGPNCLGYTNYVDPLGVGFFGAAKFKPYNPMGGPGVAVVAQSGGLMAHLKAAFDARHMQTSYTVATGNEAGLGLADFVDFLATDTATTAIVVFAEHIRRPAAFLAAGRRALAQGKPVILLHPGRGTHAQAAAQSHTGALAGDHAVMRMKVEHAGILLVDTLEQMVDLTELLSRYKTPPTEGLGIVTFSGAFCGISHDYCEDLGLEIPPLAPSTIAALTPKLPVFAPPRNPLDLTTAPAFDPPLLGVGVQAMLADPGVGSMLIAITIGPTPISLDYLAGLLPAIEGSTKPLIFSVMGDEVPLLPEFVQRAAAAGLIVLRSPERALRALALLTAYGRRRAASRDGEAAETLPASPLAPSPLAPSPLAPSPLAPSPLAPGPLAEWRGKDLLREIGIAVPNGGLATTADQAVAIAARIGFPVVMKAQAAELLHKTEAGGVILRLTDEAAVRAAWQQLHDNVGRHHPDMRLDGVLVERMSAPGLELVVGARRDPDWGPVLLVGLGGIWIEVLKDVRLLSPGAAAEQIERELSTLRAASLLDGHRGAPAVDRKAIAEAAARIGRLMLAHPEITEIDVNPLVARADGVTALDALIVAGPI